MMKYKYNVIQYLFPYGVSDIVISFSETPREEIRKKYEKSLFCIEYYGLMIEYNEMSSIFEKNKIISLDKIRPHIFHYVMRNEMDRRKLIKMIKNLNNSSI